MKALRRALSRLAALLGGQAKAEAELREEMAAHLAMATEENIRRGMKPDDARRQALLAVGGMTQAAEMTRDQRGLPWIENTVADLRFGLRHFRRTPLSTITMAGVLAIGLGTNVVLLTMLNSIATMPAPGIQRDASLVRIRGTMRPDRMAESQMRLLSWPEVQEYNAHSELFRSVAAYAEESVAIPADDPSAPLLTVNLLYTTANYFAMLGVVPALGREPAGDADVMEMRTTPTAVISHGMWQQHFNGAADVLGRRVVINGTPVEVVGVAPPRFNGTDGRVGPSIWLPLASYPLLQKSTAAVFINPDSLFLSVAARLQKGVSVASGAATVNGIAARAVRTTHERDASDPIGGAELLPLLASNSRASARDDLVTSVIAAGGLAFLVLLITCVNVSALMVGLAGARQREISVRLSLGAPRRRLIRQLLTESILLAIIAASASLFLIWLAIQGLGSRLEDAQLAVDWRVAAGTFAFAIISGVLFGITPALHATRTSVATVLRSSAAAVAAKKSRLQRSLVVLQIAFTQPLLVGLGGVVVTMVTGLGRHSSNSVAEQIAEIEVDIWAAKLPPAELSQRMTALRDEVAAMPGVTTVVPMQMGSILAQLEVPVADRVSGTTGAAMRAEFVAAPQGHFSAFSIPIVRGRDFNSAEHAQITIDPLRPMTIEAVIIGSDLARRLWGSADPIGRHLQLPGSDANKAAPMQVVGIVDATITGPSEVGGRIRVYVPYASMYTGVVARTAGPALPKLNEMQKIAAAAVPAMPVVRAQTMAQREATARREAMVTSGAVAGGGMLALLLSALGLYAVVSFMVSQRTREIGIRSALGAQQGQVIGMFFREGLALCVIGLVIGLPISMLTQRVLAVRLNMPVTTTPLIGMAIGAVVLVVASIAVWIPARRASAIDPVAAIRME